MRYVACQFMRLNTSQGELFALGFAEGPLRVPGDEVGFYAPLPSAIDDARGEAGRFRQRAGALAIVHLARGDHRLRLTLPDMSQLIQAVRRFQKAAQPLPRADHRVASLGPHS